MEPAVAIKTAPARRAVGNGAEDAERAQPPLTAPPGVAWGSSGPQATRGTGRTVRRHLGADQLAEPHEAAAHKTQADQRMHARQERRARENAEQARLNDLDTTSFIEHLTRLSHEANGARDVTMADLPPQLQALIRFIRRGIADVDAALGATDLDKRVMQLRDRIKTGARSWHQDEHGKVPKPTRPVGARARFFQAWFEGTPDPFPSKQAKKNVSSTRLLREYTAAGWKQGHQDGRLIYDPIDDVFYLTCQHYTDDMYFRVTGDGGNADVAREETATPAQDANYLSTADFDLLCYEAWERLAATLDAAAAAQHPPEQAAQSSAQPAVPPGKRGRPKKRPPEAKPVQTPDTAVAEPPPIDDLPETVQAALSVLYLARRAYQKAWADANGKVDAAAKRRAQAAKQEALSAKGGGGGKRAAASKALKPAVNPTPPVKDSNKASADPEQVAPFEFCGATFWVGHKAGYIGYPLDGGRDDPNVMFPVYTESTTVGDLTALFKTAVRKKRIDASNRAQAALMLAALLAETTRHPAAAMEALLAATGNEALSGRRQAFGDALPMAQGGTIATGGVLSNVLFSEAATAKQLILHTLGKFYKGTTEEQLIAQVARTPPGKRVGLLVTWLRAGLQEGETQQATVQSTAHNSAPAPRPAAPAPVEPSKPQVDPAQAPDPTAVPSTPYLHHGVDEIDPSTFGDEPVQRSRWTEAAANYFGTQIDPLIFAPQDVLANMVATCDYEGFTDFWAAFEHFRAEHHDAVFILAPVQVINMLDGRLPTAPYIMRPKDWGRYNAFKSAHPEYEYPR